MASVAMVCYSLERSKGASITWGNVETGLEFGGVQREGAVSQTALGSLSVDSSGTVWLNGKEGLRRCAQLDGRSGSHDTLWEAALSAERWQREVTELSHDAQNYEGLIDSAAQWFGKPVTFATMSFELLADSSRRLAASEAYEAAQRNLKAVFSDSGRTRPFLTGTPQNGLALCANIFQNGKCAARLILAETDELNPGLFDSMEFLASQTEKAYARIAGGRFLERQGDGLHSELKAAIAGEGGYAALEALSLEAGISDLAKRLYVFELKDDREDDSLRLIYCNYMEGLSEKNIAFPLGPWIVCLAVEQGGEAFAELYKNMARAGASGAFAGIREAKEHYRQAMRAAKASTGEVAFFENVAFDDLMETVCSLPCPESFSNTALSELTQNEQEALRAYIGASFSKTNAAEALGVSRMTMSRRMESIEEKCGNLFTGFDEVCHLAISLKIGQKLAEAKSDPE